MKKLLFLPLDREQTEILGSFLGMVMKNALITPELADHRTDVMKIILDKLDYEIHEHTDFCDRENCSYIEKLRREHKLKN